MSTSVVAPVYAQVAKVLRIGFRIAALFLITGLLIALVRQQDLETEADPLTKIPGRLADLDSSAFIDLAIITIVLSPLAAVLTIFLGFRRAGDTRFAQYTLAVLAILAISIVSSLLR